MKSQLPEPIEQASRYIYFDPDTGTILLGIDKLSLAFTLDEFSDLAHDISDAYINISNNINVIEVLEYDDDGNEKKVLMTVSQDENSYN